MIIHATHFESPMSFTEIPGGVTAPHGFVAGSKYCGVKAANKSAPDIALIFSQHKTVAAGTFTTNKVKAAPVRVSRAHLNSPDVRAIVANAGNANACTGVPGVRDARRMCVAAAKALGLREKQVLVCSTGRIGVALPIEKMEETIAGMEDCLGRNGSIAAARAIMTSDTFPKEVAVEFSAGGKAVRIGGIAKGAGMIDPNMATMLCFITTDAVIDRRTLQKALSVSVEQSFNRITVDGDMSTNDTVLALANGAAGNKPLKYGSKEFRAFQAALDHITRELAWMIVKDGEGVSKFVEVCVNGAASLADARRAAEAIANSTLVKCAWYGEDPNWGRIMDALGYCGAKMREEQVDIFYDGVAVVRGGMQSRTPLEKIRPIVKQKRFTICVDLNQGHGEYVVYTTDFTTDYVKLNMGDGTGG
jgi:glutamate N-acetyltransferase/amino-acid N-acetyltransferase